MAGVVISGKGRALNCSAFFPCEQLTINTARSNIVKILFVIFSYNCLRNIDKEVSYLLKFCNNVHEVNTCEVIVAVALDIHDVLLTEMISAFIDIVLCIMCIGDILEFRILKILDHYIITLLYEIHNLVQTVEKRLVEYLTVYILSLENTSDSLS